MFSIIYEDSIVGQFVSVMTKYCLWSPQHYYK